jgi:hypothetical protein
MSDKEMNAYRLTGLEEPSDEMLSALMKEVAVEAREKSIDAHRQLFQRVHKEIDRKRAEWQAKHKEKTANNG